MHCTFLKAVGMAEKCLGDDNPDTASTYNNIACIYQDMGNKEKAQEYRNKVET